MGLKRAVYNAEEKEREIYRCINIILYIASRSSLNPSRFMLIRISFRIDKRWYRCNATRGTVSLATCRENLGGAQPSRMGLKVNRKKRVAPRCFSLFLPLERSFRDEVFLRFAKVDYDANYLTFTR